MGIAEIAVGMARATTRERIRSGFGCIPFVLLYDELVKSKDIKPLKELDEKMKRKYWKETEEVKADVDISRTGELGFTPPQTRTKRIWTCQALYIFDLITKEQEPERSVANPMP
jgi:hypothetical protein